MTKTTVGSWVYAALLAATMVGTAAANSTAGESDGRYIVKFRDFNGAAAAVAAAGGRVALELGSQRAVAAYLPERALQALRNNPTVEYVEDDVLRYPLAQSTPYGIGMVQAPDVWVGGHTGDQIKVCVIDSGIHAAHEDLSGISMSGTASSGQTWNTDTCGHGSHVAGTIAARNNAVGVVGVNTGSISLHIVKVFDGASCGWSYSSTLVNAAQACQTAGAKVINMSLGGGRASTTERNAFQTLYNQGVLSVAAAGNDGSTRLSYPASYDSVISVAAVDSNKALASFSQRNSQVELAAPGVGVLSTVPQVSATASVAGVSYIVAAFEGTAQAVANANLANGGRCTTNGSGAYSGKVVLCERGDSSFADKVTNVFSGGGAGVIIYNNVPGGFSGTLGGAGPNIPAVSMSQEDGQYLVASGIGSSANVSTVPALNANGYEYYDGTSMATPHVAGVAALVWSANPSWTNAQIRGALAATAEDLGAAGRDSSFGHGLVRAKAALDYLQGNSGGGGDPAVTAKVGTIALTTTKKGPNLSTRANVSIVDGSGAALGGVAVTGCFSGATAGCATGTASSSGQISFTSSNYKSGSVTFCVTGVTGTNVTFESSAGDCKSN